jgi:hypothetical protein
MAGRDPQEVYDTPLELPDDPEPPLDPELPMPPPDPPELPVPLELPNPPELPDPPELLEGFPGDASRCTPPSPASEASSPPQPKPAVTRPMKSVPIASLAPMDSMMADVHPIRRAGIETMRRRRRTRREP